MSYEVTKSRIWQWIGIILIVGVFAGAYWYFQVRASTLNKSPTGSLTSGLVGYWTFDGADVSGTSATDRSGNSNTGTLTNGPVIAEGKIGQGLSFDGVNDYVNITSIPSALFANTTFTASGWFKTSTADRSILSQDNCDGGWFISMDSNSKLNVSLRTNGSCGAGSASRVSAMNVADGVWHHFATVITTDTVTAGNNNINIYVDGVLNQGSLTAGTTYGTAGDNKVQIGARYSGDRPFSGSMDETRIYNRALSAGEIQSLYALGQSDKTNSAVSQPQGTGRLDSGLAGYWPLDDGSGISATDSSTNANTGTLHGGPTWTTGRIASAVDFDGTNDEISIADPASGVLDITDTTNFTFSGWFNRDTFTTDDALFTKRVGVAAGNTGYIAYIDDATDKLTFEVSDGTDEYQMESSSTFTATGWNHFTIVWNDSSSTLTKMYINGVEETTTNTGTFGNVNSLANNVTFYFGTYLDVSEFYQYPFDGKMDDMRFYNRALSSDEVSQLYRLNTPMGVDTSLKGYWSFNGTDIAGTTAYDRSGTSNNCTLTNGPIVNSGVVGQGLFLDGSNDYVNCTNASVFQNTTGTISAWIKTNGAGSSYRGIVTKQNAYGMYLKDNVLIMYDWGTYADRSTGINLADNKWHLVTATFQSGVSAYIYIDGTLVLSTAMTVSNQGDVVTVGNGGVAAGQNFAGAIDEVRIYNRALSAGEIQSLYALGQSDKVNSSVSQPQGTGRLDSGLAGYWKLDNGSGTTATDSSTNGNDGTVPNSWTTGQVGGAVSFDGSTRMAVSAGTGIIDAKQDVTMAAWVYPRATIGYRGWFYKGVAGCDEATAKYMLENDLVGKLRIWMGGSYLTSNTSLSINQWQHIVATNSAAGSAIYLNGVLVASGSALPTPASSSEQWRFNTCNSIDANMDDIRIYNRAISSDEVSQLYRLNTPTGVDTSLKGYWSFNGTDIAGTTAYDRSGAGNTGTLTNGPVIAEGKLGQAIAFDNSDDYVSVADADTLDVIDSTNFSLTGWFRRTTATTDDVIVAKRNGITAGDTGYIAYLDDATDKFTLEVSDGTDEYQLESSATFTDSDWHHFTLSWNDSSATSTFLYIDGSYETTTATGTFANVNSLANALTLRMGAESDNGNPFSGALDEIRVYKKALSASEVWDQYLASASTMRTCGTVTDADGNVYGTVKIGTQCWMKQNMRVGTRIAAATSQTNNATTEKYCYSDSDSNCTSNNPNQPDGGLYQWNEAMQYSTTAGARGICPAGFHIPTDTQQYTLENYLKNSGQSCDASRSGYDCSSAGTKLKPGGTSGFESNPAGYANSGSFFDRGSHGGFWSSSESGANAWHRYLFSSVATVYRYADDKSSGLSVRCLQD